MTAPRRLFWLLLLLVLPFLVLVACGMARAAWVGAGETLISGAGAAGATAFVARALDPAWRTLVF